MASSSRSVFSETLQEITNTKLEELSKRRSDFEATKSSVLSELAKENEPAQRLSILSRGVKTCFGLNLNKHGKARNAFNPSRNSELELELKNLDCFLAQAKYDPSLSAKTMRASEESLLRHLDVQSLKYQYASLYAQLVTEWLSTEKSMGSDLDDIAMMDGFEDVASEVKRDAREQWEHTVFDPAKVDEEALRAYLNKLFNAESAETSPELKALKQLRDDIADFEGDMLAPNQFNSTTLRWAADGLLSSGLLSDEKRDVLKEIKNNPIILGEVADVLNMRIQYLDSWSWGSKPVLLEQRRQISGIYNVLMHEDLLQAIFLQYIGVKWSVFLKKAFVKFRTVDGAWKSSRKRISQTDTMRRSYYLGSESRGNSVQSIRDHIYSKHYFMANLMDSESQRSDIAEGEEEVDYHSNHVPPQMPIPAAPMAQQAPAARGGFGLGSGQAHSGPLFGQPSGQAQSSLFGQGHMAQMRAAALPPPPPPPAARRGQKGAANIVDYLKSLMQERFGVSNIPDAYLFFPMELGGLDLKSPFISILQVHDTVVENPSKTMDTFFEAEKEAYHHRKKEYEDGNVSRPMWQVEAGREWKPEKKDLEEFMSFSEYARYREDIRYGFEKNLHWVYKTLLKIPQEEGLEGASVSILSGLDALKQQEGGTGRGIKGDWNSMEPYWQWVAQLYGPEVMDRFGGLNIVEPGLLPMGMVSIFRDKRVKWQG
ncbi:hypothetical protein GGR54DRAFT_373931 [Hypoxylon sp. NC1633]|nr:hypothetical protein GGR54DRAFT_373931 [Hypoxylon sp. NC1633]